MSYPAGLWPAVPAEVYYEHSSPRDDKESGNSYLSPAEMARQAEPASVEDVSDKTNNTIPNTRRSATSSTSTKPSPKRQRTIDVVGRSKTKSARTAITCHSREPVPLIDAVGQYVGPWPMTILSGRTDRELAGNEISGFRFRKLFYEGR